MAPSTSAVADPPRKRQKLTTTACEPCRSRKIRCDGNKPSCEACSKRSQQCIYQATTDVKHVNTYVDSLVQRVSQLEQELENAHATILRLSTSPSIAAPPPLPPAPAPHHNIDPRLLPDHERSLVEAGLVDAMGGDAGIGANGNADHSFYGSSSDLGFTRQMYGTILQKQDAPSVSETTGATSSVQQLPILPAPTAAYIAAENFTLLPRELADRLMFLYWDRVHVLYPFLHKASFNQAYENLWKPASEHQPCHRPGLGLGASKEAGPSSVIFHCAFNAVLALGMQFSDLPLNEKERLSAACLAKSKDLLKLDLFDDGNIALVQTLLLLTQYFQSTNWPSKCWTSIGLACRLAQGLGLHIEEDRFEQQFSATDREMRRRIWHGCVTLDVIVSMTLGRPAMLIGSSARSLPEFIDGDEVYPFENAHNNPISSIDFFTEAVKLYRIVGRILLNIYKINDEQHEYLNAKQEDRTEDILQEFDDELARFTGDLPKALKWQSPTGEFLHTTAGTLARQSHVLHVRVLHARILLLRPAFLQFCRSHTSNNDQRSTEAKTGNIDYATACVRTALELIASVKEYSATEATGAWWYNVFYTRTAAMVVLLSGVCSPICDVLGDEPWQEAWTSCVQILTKNLPQYKPVKACLATLTALRENVIRQRSGVKVVESHRLPYSEQDAETQNALGQGLHSNAAATSVPIPIPNDSQFLLDSTFDLFWFVESDLFSDFGCDFTQPQPKP